MKRILLTLALTTVASAALAAPAPYVFDIPKKFPAAYAGYRKALPVQYRSDPWLARLEGASGPMKASVVDGKPMLSANECQPHDCGFNDLYVLVTPQRMVAMAALTDDNQRSSTLFIGNPTSSEKACLKKMADTSSDAC